MNWLHNGTGGRHILIFLDLLVEVQRICLISEHQLEFHSWDMELQRMISLGEFFVSQEILEQMLLAGMNIARINLAHGALDDHQQTIANLRAASRSTGKRLAIFADLPGPKMRVGVFNQEAVHLERGQDFTLHNQEIIGDQHRASVNFEGLPAVVKPGDWIRTTQECASYTSGDAVVIRCVFN